jgi:hypothetical protein
MQNIFREEDDEALQSAPAGWGRISAADNESDEPELEAEERTAAPKGFSEWLETRRSTDADNKAFESYIAPFGPNMAGHFLAHPAVIHVRPAAAGALAVRLHDDSRLTCSTSAIRLHNRENDANVAFIVETALEMGWRKVRLEGSPAFCSMMARALQQEGIAIVTAPKPRPKRPPVFASPPARPGQKPGP